jgi:hypothetical protein
MGQPLDYCFSKTEANRQERQELIGWEKNESLNSLCALPVRIQQPADIFTKKKRAATFAATRLPRAGIEILSAIAVPQSELCHPMTE